MDKSLRPYILGGVIGFAGCYLFLTSQKSEPTEKKPRKKIRVLATMVADCCHIGHIGHVKRARQTAEKLSGSKDIHFIVGIHSDETVMSYKRKPLFSMEERIDHMRHVPGVDEVVGHAPLDLTLEYLDSLNVDFVGGNLMEGDSQKAKEYNSQYQVIIDAGKFMNIPRTDGISTTEIIERARHPEDRKVRS